jgi:hypothetical protein
LNGRFSTVSAKDIHSYSGTGENTEGEHVLIEDGSIHGYYKNSNDDINTRYFFLNDGNAGLGS